jgi:hypothetical protein
LQSPPSFQLAAPALVAHHRASLRSKGGRHDRIQCRSLSGKARRDQEFLDAHKKVQADWPGLKHVNMIKTGERSYCIIAEWSDMDALANARPHMIATLNSFRDTLEDLGGGLGVTDPVAGPVVLELK